MEKLTESGCKTRRERLIAATDADQIIVSSPHIIQYLSGLFISPLLLNQRESSYFLLIDTSTGHTTLVVHNVLGDVSAYADEVFQIHWYDNDHMPSSEIYRTLLPELKQHRSSGRLAVELGSFPHGAAAEDQVVLDLSPTLWRMRRQKDPDELVLIREAVRGIEAGHRAARAVIKPGITELDIYNALYTGIVNEVGSGVLPLGDFVSGKHPDRMGGMATNRVLQSGELMIIDVFPLVNGYRADFTSTLSTDGQMSNDQRRLETALHAGMAAGESLLKAGTPTRDVFATVRGALVENGFDLTHHAGHGLGLKHPEAPYFVPASDEILMAGDVMTLEPGAYNDQFGARIERNYLITETGYELLTHHDINF